VVNAPRSGKNPGFVDGGRRRRDSCGAAGSACHEPMGSPSNADDDILYSVARNQRQVSNNASDRSSERSIIQDVGGNSWL